ELSFPLSDFRFTIPEALHSKTLRRHHEEASTQGICRGYRSVAKQAGLSYELRPMDFNGIIPGLQTRNLDVALAGITIRDDRKKLIDFSDPYYESGLAVLVGTNNNDIKDAADLNGKLVAVKIG